MSPDLAKVRNIGIAAHIDAGKTTTTERFLYYTGKTHRLGDVDDGTTVTDFDQEEQQRGITIYSAAVTLPWKEHTINLIDTPGHVDFTAEVERALRVLDGVVVVFDAKEGVEAQSETVWRQASKYRVPKICFINKMDKLGADFEMAVRTIHDRLGGNPVAVQIPIGAEGFFVGHIDLLTLQAVYYDKENPDAKLRYEPIPENLKEVSEKARHDLEVKVAEVCEAMLEKFVNEEPVSVDELRQAIREATLADDLQPVFVGSALDHMGTRPLLDGVLDYLPSPLDCPPVTGQVPEMTGRRGRVVKQGREVAYICDPNGPLVAYVFKVVAEKPLDIFFVRIYSGTLRAGSRVFNPVRDRKENVSRMFRIFARKREQIAEAVAGDIVALMGLKESLTGDTLCDQKDPVVLESIEFPETVISMSIEPQSSADRDKMIEALNLLARENPTFEYQSNEETGQTLIKGMGELHLEVLVNRLKREMNVGVRVGNPRVSFRDTVTTSAECEEEFSRQSGGRGMYARVKLRVEPYEPAPGEERVVFVRQLPSDVLIKREYLTAIEDAVRDAAPTGVRGFPMINMKVTLTGAAEHEADSTEGAFEAAARIAFDKAVEMASPALMEPIMKVEVVTPEIYFGTVSGDLTRRRGIVQDSELRGDQRALKAIVPLREMFGYATDLRSISQGRGSWTMEPSHYAQAPSQVSDAILGGH